VWDSKDKDRKKFAVKDFLTTAEGRLEAKVVWRESVEAARQAAIRKDIEEGNKTNAAEQNRPEPQGESVDDLFARLEREAATQGAEQ
jgi:TPP-dependent pyruvate/acetoin dehydrogenase alpha subunit